jgi:phage protein D
MPLNDLDIPVFAVKVNRQPLEVAMNWQITRIVIDDHVDLPSMFTLELDAFDDTDSNPAWLNDEKVFAIGDEVTIQLGYANDPNELRTEMTGEVTFVEIQFTAASLPRLAVRGYDRRHRLQRGSKIRTFQKLKDSEIAKQIATEAGLAPEVIDSEVIHEYLIQANQTDFEFLQERAKRIHYELVVQDKKLYFRPVAYDAGPNLRLSIKNELSEFSAQLSTAGQTGKTIVQGWDVKTKQAFAETANDCLHMSEGLTGAALVSKAFGQAQALISDVPAASVGEVIQRAKAGFAANALGLIRAEGSCQGRNDIKVGSVVKINDVGQRFSGNYYIKAVTHTYDTNSYQSHFIAWRNAT